MIAAAYPVDLTYTERKSESDKVQTIIPAWYSVMEVVFSSQKPMNSHITLAVAFFNGKIYIDLSLGWLISTTRTVQIQLLPLPGDFMSTIGGGKGGGEKYKTKNEFIRKGRE